MNKYILLSNDKKKSAFIIEQTPPYQKFKTKY